MYTTDPSAKEHLIKGNMWCWELTGEVGGGFFMENITSDLEEWVGLLSNIVTMKQHDTSSEIDFKTPDNYSRRNLDWWGEEGLFSKWWELE